MCEVHSFLVDKQGKIYDEPNVQHHSELVLKQTEAVAQFANDVLNVNRLNSIRRDLMYDDFLKPEFILEHRKLDLGLNRWTTALNSAANLPPLSDNWTDVDGQLKDKYQKRIDTYLQDKFSTRKKLIDYAEKNQRIIQPIAGKFLTYRQDIKRKLAELMRSKLPPHVRGVAELVEMHYSDYGMQKTAIFRVYEPGDPEPKQCTIHLNRAELSNAMYSRPTFDHFIEEIKKGENLVPCWKELSYN
jgi:hypothetical protein